MLFLFPQCETSVGFVFVSRKSAWWSAAVITFIVTMRVDYRSYKSTPGYILPIPGNPCAVSDSDSRSWGDPMKAFTKSTMMLFWDVMKLFLVSEWAEDPAHIHGPSGPGGLKEVQAPSGHPGLVSLIPFIPKVGPWEGCRTHAKTFWWRWALRPCTSPIVVVLFPSPRGVGVILQDESKTGKLHLCKLNSCVSLSQLWS